MQELHIIHKAHACSKKQVKNKENDLVAVTLALKAVGNPPTRKIVGGQLYRHLVTRENLDEILAHLPGDMREHLVSVIEFDSKHGVGQWLNHRSLHLNHVFFRHSFLLLPIPARP